MKLRKKGGSSCRLKPLKRQNIDNKASQCCRKRSQMPHPHVLSGGNMYFFSMEKKRSNRDMCMGVESVRKRWFLHRLRMKFQKFLEEFFPVHQRQSEVKRTQHQYCNGLSRCHNSRSLNFCVELNAFSPEQCWDGIIEKRFYGVNVEIYFL